MNLSEVPQGFRASIVVVLFAAMVVSAFAWADSRVDAKIDRALAPLEPRLDRLEEKVDRILDHMLEKK